MGKFLTRAMSIIAVFAFVLCGLQQRSYASTYSDASAVCLTKLQQVNANTSSVCDPLMLYNGSGQTEAICYRVLPSGYAIFNPQNNILIEFSFESNSPYHNSSLSQDEKFLYNGPASYYKLKNDIAIDLITNKQFPVAQMNVKSTNNISAPSISATNTIIQPMTLIAQGSLTYPLRTWYTSSYYCGVNGSTILLMYYQDHYTGTYVPTNYRTSSTLCNYLVSGGYLWNAGMSSYDLVYGYSGGFTGLRQYFTNNVTGTTKIPYFSSYNFTTITNHISNNRPIILATTSDHPQIGNHHVVVHGYVITTSDQYLLVNNDYGSNNVYFTSLQNYYNGYVYLN